MTQYTFLSATILLVLMTDPIGNIPIFANALRPVAPARRPWVILFLIALRMVFPPPTGAADEEQMVEPLIVPLARLPGLAHSGERGPT